MTIPNLRGYPYYNAVNLPYNPPTPFLYGKETIPLGGASQMGLKEEIGGGNMRFKELRRKTAREIELKREIAEKMKELDKLTNTAKKLIQKRKRDQI